MRSLQSEHPLHCIIGIVHFNKWHEDSAAVCQHLVCLGCFQGFVDDVFDCVCGSVHIDLHNIALLEATSFIASWWKFVPISSVVAHCVAWIVGVSLIFLFNIVNYTNLNASILCFRYFYFEFGRLVVKDGLVENVLSPIAALTMSGVLHFEPVHFKTVAVFLLQTENTLDFFSSVSLPVLFLLFIF